jgi:hypothetical protein
MKKLFLIALIAVFVMTTGCAALQPKKPIDVSKMPQAEIDWLAKELAGIAEVVRDPVAKSESDGILIKIDKKDKSQKALVEAVQILEKLYGTPLVLISGGTADTGDGTKVSIVRYSLYFKVSSTMYTVVLISNGMITEIMSINNVGGKVLATKTMKVSEVLEVTGITEESN